MSTRRLSIEGLGLLRDMLEDDGSSTDLRVLAALSPPMSRQGSAKSLSRQGSAADVMGKYASSGINPHLVEESFGRESEWAVDDGSPAVDAADARLAAGHSRSRTNSAARKQSNMALGANASSADILQAVAARQKRKDSMRRRGASRSIADMEPPPQLPPPPAMPMPMPMPMPLVAIPQTFERAKPPPGAVFIMPPPKFNMPPPPAMDDLPPPPPPAFDDDDDDAPPPPPPPPAGGDDDDDDAPPPPPPDASSSPPPPKSPSGGGRSRKQRLREEREAKLAARARLKKLNLANDPNTTVVVFGAGSLGLSFAPKREKYSASSASTVTRVAGQAEELGVRVGDSIVEIGGVDVTKASQGEVLAAFKGASRPLPVRFRRIPTKASVLAPPPAPEPEPAPPPPPGPAHDFDEGELEDGEWENAFDTSGGPSKASELAQQAMEKAQQLKERLSRT